MKLRYLAPLAIAVAAFGLPQQAGDPKDIAALPDDPGKAAVVKMCFDCHDSGNFRKARRTEDGWSDSVDSMMMRGAQGTPEEADAVVVYLTKYFGKDAPVRINTAPFAELRGVLRMTVAEAVALREYREKNGPFKTVDDLKKVAGLDAAKIEAFKAKLMF